MLNITLGALCDQAKKKQGVPVRTSEGQLKTLIPWVGKELLSLYIPPEAFSGNVYEGPQRPKLIKYEEISTVKIFSSSSALHPYVLTF